MVNKNFISKNTTWLIILIITVTSLIYAKSLTNSFIFDDSLVIVNNDFVKSWRNFPLIFSKSYLTSLKDIDYLGLRNIGAGEIGYRPVVTLSYFIDYSFWKLKPLGYHLTNLILHIFNVVLLYFLIHLIVKNKKIALLASLLFALHPVNTEAVDVISFREDLLAFLFFIFSFILFIKSDECIGKKKFYYYAISIVSFLLALFSKEMAATLPLILMLYDYFFVFQTKIRETLRHIRSRYLGYFASLLFYFIVRFFLMANINEFHLRYPGGNFYTNILTMSKVFATYIQWILLPINIHLVLPGDPSFIPHSFFTPKVLLSISLLIIYFGLALRLRKTSKEISFAILWFFITLLPVSNILPIRNYMASRYLYLPVVGFCLLIAMLIIKLPTLKISSLSEEILRRVAKDAIIVLLVFYSIFTMIRNLVWKNDITLWLEMVEIYPNSPAAHRNLGQCFRNSGLLDEAINEYKLAISLNPNYAKDYNYLGLCYYGKGMLDEGIREFRKALELNPKLLDVYISLGTILGDKGLYKEAISYFEKAIRIDPKYTQAYNDLGVTYARMEKWDEARKAWMKALEIDVTDKDAQDNLRKLKTSGH